MDNNLILSRLRYALDLKDSEMIRIWSLGGFTIDASLLNTYLKKEEDPGYEECPHKVLAHFLDGLILEKRGPKKDGKAPVLKDDLLSNNMILKKLRIAFNMREEDMLKTFEKADFTISKPELSALFRKEGHTHYRVCGDQMLRRFLLGLTKKDE